MNKKNIIIKLFEPSERRKYVFCGLKSAQGVIKTPGARVFALVLRYMRNQYIFVKEYKFLRKDRGTYKEYFSYYKEVHIY